MYHHSRRFEHILLSNQWWCTHRKNIRVDRISKENYWQPKSNRHIEKTVPLQRTHSFQIHSMCKSWSHKASLNQFQRMHTHHTDYIIYKQNSESEQKLLLGNKHTARMNKAKSWFFKNNEISTPLATLNKEKKKEGINNIRNEKIKNNYEWFWQQKDSKSLTLC